MEREKSLGRTRVLLIFRCIDSFADGRVTVSKGLENIMYHMRRFVKVRKDDVLTEV